ncbi:MAG: flavin reductase family protein [Dehalococcoidales bacterium]|nr:flavin reductase family protein [Dehalococcoidales bacterium]
MKIDPAALDKRGMHDLMMSAIVPRPIAFISTLGENGVNNLAPFSAFTVVAMRPSLVCFSAERKRDGKKKDTLINIEYSGEFVINAVDEAIAEAMNITSAEYPPEVSEFAMGGLTPVRSDLVKAPGVAESPVRMECRLTKILEFGKEPEGSALVIGQVMLVHIKDEMWTGRYVDREKFKAIGRIGGMDGYCRLIDIFRMKRPQL